MLIKTVSVYRYIILLYLIHIDRLPWFFQMVHCRKNNKYRTRNMPLGELLGKNYFYFSKESQGAQ
jgi:hypothetical protein